MPKSQNPFEKNSWYFRNSLVRANYTNMTKGIYMNTEYLEKFFRYLLLGEVKYDEISKNGSFKTNRCR